MQRYSGCQSVSFANYCDGSTFVVVEWCVLLPMSVACVRASVALSVSNCLDTGDPGGPFFMAKGAETDRSCDLAILLFGESASQVVPHLLYLGQPCCSPFIGRAIALRVGEQSLGLKPIERRYSVSIWGGFSL